MTLFGVLTVVFVTLKLMAIIDWPWWLVFSPLIIGVAIDMVVLFIASVFFNKF